MVAPIKVTLDASAVKVTSGEFNRAVSGMIDSVQRLDKETSTAVNRINSSIRRLDFSALTRGLSQLAAARPSSDLIRNIDRLSTSLNNIRGPSATVVRNVQGIATAVSSFRAPSGTGDIIRILNAVSRFNPPNAATTANLTSFVRALSSIQINTANLATATREMSAFAAAAQRAASSVRQLNSIQARAPIAARPSPTTPGSGYSFASRRMGPYDGIFSGNTRATGELRGLENAMNPMFQGASLLRTAVGAITLGSFVKEVYDAGNAFVQVHHMMEIVAKDAKEVAGWFQEIGDIANTFGQRLDAMQRGFAVFATSAMASGWSRQQAINTYSNMASVATSVGLTPEQTERVYHTVDAALSSGQLMRGVLTRQLSPLIPGMTTEAAKLYFNMERNKPLDTPLNDKELLQAETDLMKSTRRAQLSANILAPIFERLATKYEGGLPTAQKSARAAENRMANEWFVMKNRTFDAGFGEGITDLWNTITKIMQRPEIVQFFDRLGKGMGDAARAVGDMLRFMADNLSTVVMVFKGFVALGAIELMLRLGGAIRTVGIIAAAAATPVRGLVMAATGTAALAARGAAAIGTGMSVAGGAAAAAAMSRTNATQAALAARVASLGGAGAGAATAAASTAAATTAASAAAATTAMTSLRAAGAATATALMGAFTVAASVIKIGMVGAVAAIAMEWDKAVKGQGDRTVGEYFKAVFSKVGEDAVKVFNDIATGIVKIFDTITGNSREGTKSWIGDMNDWAITAIALIDLVRESFMTLWDSAKIILSGIASAAGPIASVAGGAAIGGRFGGAAGAALGGAAGLVGNASSFVNWATGTGPGISEQLSARMGQFNDFMKNFMSPGYLAGFNNIIDLSRSRRAAQDNPSTVPRKPTPNSRPTVDNLGYGMPGSTAGGGKGTANQMYQAWLQLRDSVSGYDKALDTLSKDMAILNYATQHFNVTGEEQARIQAGIKDKILSSLGVMDQSTKATFQFSNAVGTLNALEKMGIITQEEKARHLQTVATNYEKAAKPVDYWLRQQGQEIALMRLGNKEREVEAKLQQEIQRIREQGGTVSKEQEQMMRLTLQYAQQMGELNKDMETGLQHWANGFRSVYTELAKIEEKIADDIGGAIGEMAAGGKVDFQSMVDSWYKDIMKMMGKDLFRSFLQMLGIIGPMGASPTGGSLLGGMMGLASPQQQMNQMGLAYAAQMQALGMPESQVAAVMSGNMQALSPATQVAMANAMAMQSGAQGVAAMPRGMGMGAGLLGAGAAASFAMPGGGSLPIPPIPPGGGLPIPPIPPDLLSDVNINIADGTTATGNTIGAAGGVMPGLYGLNSMAMAPLMMSGNPAMSMLGMGGSLLGGLGGGGGGGNFLFGNADANGGGGIMTALFGKEAANMWGLTSPTSDFMKSGGLFGWLTGKGEGGGLWGSLFGGGASGNLPIPPIPPDVIPDLLGDSAVTFGTQLSQLTQGGAIPQLLGDSAAGGGGLLSSILGSSGGSSFGMLGSIFQGLGTAVQSIFSGIMSIFSGMFDEGGVSTNAVKFGMAPASLWAKAPSYASGTSNTSYPGGGIPVIAHPNEAIIPLSRGRSIPVEFPEGAGMGGGNGVTNNFYIQTPNADSFRKSQGQIMKDAGTTMSRYMRRN